MNQKGFAPLLILLTVVAVLVSIPTIMVVFKDFNPYWNIRHNTPTNTKLDSAKNNADMEAYQAKLKNFTESIKNYELTNVGTATQPYSKNGKILVRAKDKDYILNENLFYKDEKLNSRHFNITNKYADFPSYTLFYLDNKLYQLDKNTNIVEQIALPQEISNSNYKGVIILDTGKEKALITFYDENAFVNADGFAYLYIPESRSFTHLDVFPNECGAIYCSEFPYNVAETDTNRLLFVQGGGDACWAQGFVGVLNIETMEMEKTINYSIGCYTEYDTFIGFYKGKIITAGHDYVEYPDEEFLFNNSRTIYKSVNMLDHLTSDKVVLLNYEEMPAEITEVHVFEKDDLLVLKNLQEDLYFFKISDNEVKELKDINYSIEQLYEEKNQNNLVIEETVNTIEPPYEIQMDIFNLTLTSNEVSYHLINTGPLNRMFGNAFGYDSECIKFGAGFKFSELIDDKAYFLFEQEKNTSDKCNIEYPRFIYGYVDLVNYNIYATKDLQK